MFDNFLGADGADALQGVGQQWRPVLVAIKSQASSLNA
jgi:hypothetical protein